MQGSLLLLLGAVLLVSALGAWLGFSGRRRYYRRYRVVAAGGFLVLAPFLCYALWRQHHARSELAAWGLAPHPAIAAAQGLPGSARSGGTWIFTVDAEPESILDFYTDPTHTPGWAPTFVHPAALFFERGEHQLLINIQEGAGAATVVYSIDRVGG